MLSKDGVVGRGCSDDNKIYLDNGSERVISHSYSQGDHFIYLDSIPYQSNQEGVNLNQLIRIYPHF